ncbi:hypothetical protein [Fluviispira sanaruensis]|uniref:Uncharacterized protein n=1 Tax=Fluviispira sanaruensis TaxID=2493639 RepID=A0A4P2VPB4_FLUSA|nr:hypothetical protein [Fluviispira sanaruensis]BBH54074.1 hypothetical protein JCM31447_25310 [Fluviispira sanaruensis]
MTKKVVFITYWPFNVRDAYRFDLSPFTKYGINYEYWDISLITDYEYHQKYIQSNDDELEISNYYTFNFVEEVLLRISQCQKIFVIMFPPLEEKYIWLYKYITEYKIEYCYMYINCIPFIKDISLKRLVKNALTIILKPFFLFSHSRSSHNVTKGPKLLILGGEKSKESIHKYLIKKKIPTLWAHNNDYDQYLKEKINENNNFNKDKYIVFLDEFFPFHSDLIYYKNIGKINADVYYNSLCDFFYKLENYTGYKVIIAAHPSSYYPKMQKNYFGGREVIKNNTLELVKNSELVVCHSSTSVSFANLFEKSILFIAMNEIINMSKLHSKCILVFSKYFGKKYIYIDKIKNFDKIKNNLFLHSKKKYLRYRNDFIKKSGTSEKFIFDILAEYLINNNS